MKEGAYEGKVSVLGPKRGTSVSINREKTDANKASGQDPTKTHGSPQACKSYTALIQMIF